MPILQPTKVTNRDSGELFDDQSNSTASKLINSSNVLNQSTDILSADKRTITEAEIKTLSHFEYDPNQDQLIADRAIETTLNSLFLPCDDASGCPYQVRVGGPDPDHPGHFVRCYRQPQQP